MLRGQRALFNLTEGLQLSKCGTKLRGRYPEGDLERASGILFGVDGQIRSIAMVAREDSVERRA